MFAISEMSSMRQNDIIIIGAGGIGCAIARELSRYKLSITVLEKECDIAAGASGRNSAVVHAGFNNRPGSLMARLCVEGNQGFEDICRELDVPFKNTGKILVAFDDEDIQILRGIIAQGEQNGCEGLRMIGEEELKRLSMQNVTSENGRVYFDGDNGRVSYDSLLWYFAAKHTAIDSYEKRGKKGPDRAGRGLCR